MLYYLIFTVLGLGVLCLMIWYESKAYPICSVCGHSHSTKGLATNKVELDWRIRQYTTKKEGVAQ